MPHSSGGGSHSGGSSHSSSHSSGGGSHSGGGRSAPPIYSSYHTGTHRYVYYHNHRPVYYFSSQRASGDPVSAVFLLIFLIIWIAMSMPFWIMSIHIPQKVAADYDTSIVIEDNAQIFSPEEEYELGVQLNNFLELSGVTPSVITVNESDWVEYYYDLETYAYDLYVNRFPDEKHWLIVYSTQAKAENEFDDWKWEGMAGDEITPAVTSSKERQLTSIMQKNLTARTRYTVSEAIGKTFDELSVGLMNPQIDWPSFFFMVIFDGLALIVMIPQIISGFKDIGRANAVRCKTDQEKPQEDVCEYCGGVYVHGLHISCPHCGAPIKVAEQKGNSI